MLRRLRLDMQASRVGSRFDTTRLQVIIGNWADVPALRDKDATSSLTAVQPQRQDWCSCCVLLPALGREVCAALSGASQASTSTTPLRWRPSSTRPHTSSWSAASSRNELRATTAPSKHGATAARRTHARSTSHTGDTCLRSRQTRCLQRSSASP